MSKARELAELGGAYNDAALSNRNVIINGAMMLSQRQTSSSNVGNQYVLDRFQVYKQNTGSTYTCSQNSVTDLEGFANSLKMDCTTADTSLASNEQVYISYFAEGQDCQRLKKGHGSDAVPTTLSFYVKTNKTGLYTVSFFDRDNTRKVNGSYTVANTNWNRYSITFPADASGKLDDDNASSLEIFFNLVAGSDTNTGTLYTAWQAAADAGSATGQVNFADSTSNDWEITGVQLEVGSEATPFEHRSFGEEVALRQGYYIKYGAGGGGGAAFCSNASDTYRRAHITHPVEQRAAGTLTITWSAGSGAGSLTQPYMAYGYVNAGNTSDYINLTSLISDAEL